MTNPMDANANTPKTAKAICPPIRCIQTATATQTAAVKPTVANARGKVLNMSYLKNKIPNFPNRLGWAKSQASTKINTTKIR